MASEQEVERLVVRLMGNNKEYRKMIDDSVKQTLRLEKTVDKSMKNIGNSMKSMGRNLSLKVTLPLTIMGGVAVKAFSDFDKAMTESTAIMKVTTSQAAEMKKIATELSTDGSVNKGPRDLAESYFFLASAGKNAEQSMALLPRVAEFATAGAFDMALATDLLTDAQSALGMSSKDVATDTKNLVKISDALVKANTLANASVQQFSEALTSDAATASRTINAELETTLAILALYADKGKKAAEAGNLFGRATRLLTKASRDNANEFAQRNIKVIDEATGEYRNFIDIIDDMNKAFDGMTGPEIGKALSDLGFEALAQKSILPLLGATDQLKFYEEELRNAGGTTKEISEKQMKSFANQMTIVKNVLTVTAIEIGEILVPAVEFLGAKIVALSTWWKALSPQVKKASVIFLSVVAVVGPLLTLFGTMIVMIGAVSSAMAAMSAATGLAAVAVGLLNFAIASLIVVGIAVVMVAAAEAMGLFGQAAEDANINLARQNKLLKERIGIIGGNITKTEDKGDLKQIKKRIEREMKFADEEVVRQQKRKSKAEQSGWVGFGAGGEASGFGLEGADADAARQIIATTKHREELAKQLEAVNKKIAKETAAPQQAASGAQGSAPPQKTIQETENLSKKVNSLTKDLQMQAELFGVSARGAAIYKLQLEGASEAELKAARAADALLTQFETAQKVEDFTTSLQQQVATFGMTADQLEIYKLKLEGATDAQLALAKSNQALLKSMKVSKEIKDFNKSLQKSIETFGMTSNEVKLYELKMKGATEAELAQAQTSMTTLANLEKQKKLQDANNQALEKLTGTAAGSVDALAKVFDQRQMLALPRDASQSNFAQQQAQKSLGTPGTAVASSKASGNSKPISDESSLKTIAMGITKLVELEEAKEENVVIVAAANLSGEK